MGQGKGKNREQKQSADKSVLLVHITARTGRLVQSLEYKDLWIKRDKNLGERQKEKDLMRLRKKLKEDRD